MTQDTKSSLRTLIFVIVLVPVIGWLVMFSLKKNSESAQRAQVCQEECAQSGAQGHEFSWNILSGPVCKCIE